MFEGLRFQHWQPVRDADGIVVLTLDRAGSSVNAGRIAYTYEQALDCFREADAVARRPYIYLSAGVSSEQFVESLQLAAAAGARFSGVLCGRATWQDGVGVFARDGAVAFENWLATKGTTNIGAVNACLKAATPWRERIGLH